MNLVEANDHVMYHSSHGSDRETMERRHQVARLSAIAYEESRKVIVYHGPLKPLIR